MTIRQTATLAAAVLLLSVSPVSAQQFPGLFPQQSVTPSRTLGPQFNGRATQCQTSGIVNPFQLQGQRRQGQQQQAQQQQGQQQQGQQQQGQQQQRQRQQGQRQQGQGQQGQGQGQVNLLLQYLAGTWHENYNGVLMTHVIRADGLHTIRQTATGWTKSHYATATGLTLRLLDGSYILSQSQPNVVKLQANNQTRYWSRTPLNRQVIVAADISTGGGTNGGTTGGTTTITSQAALPGAMQGTWFDITRNNQLYRYDLRANSYDMYELDPATNQIVVENGQPVQLLRQPLTYINGVLTLSPGQDAEGPYTVLPAADGSQLGLRSIAGSETRLLSRRSRN